jgi:hypothetical protein
LLTADLLVFRFLLFSSDHQKDHQGSYNKRKTEENNVLKSLGLLDQRGQACMKNVSQAQVNAYKNA